ncbi:hypothetical protein MRX96_024512 [Rhipicephalus microplus]
MEDDERGAGPSAGMKPQFFYSAMRARRPRFVPLEDADEIFAQLDNGNLSDVGDTEDEEDDDFVFEETGSNDGVLETREASDESDESDEEQACQETSWCRKAFQKPSADFRGVCDENEPLQGPVEDVRYDQTGHWLVAKEQQQRCMLEGCKGKPRIKCEKCNDHLCLINGRNCFKEFYVRH